MPALAHRTQTQMARRRLAGQQRMRNQTSVVGGGAATVVGGAGGSATLTPTTRFYWGWPNQWNYWAAPYAYPYWYQPRVCPVGTRYDVYTNRCVPRYTYAYGYARPWYGMPMYSAYVV